MLGEKVCRRGLVTHWSAGVERSRRPPVKACGEFGGGGGRRALLGRAGRHALPGASPSGLGRQTMRTIVLSWRVYLVFARPAVPGVNRSGVKFTVVNRSGVKMD